MSANCNICNRVIESHLREQKKEFCFTCLVERVSDSGALASFKIKEKPIQAPCAVCDRDVSGRELGPSPWGFICGSCRACCETQTGFHMEDLSLSAAREWLIRSVRKIMGPYSTDEVHHLLLEQRVVSLDEICKPFSRWQLIRDNEVFRFTLNEIKNKKDAMVESKEQTASGTATDVVTESLIINPFQRTDRLLEGTLPPMRTEAETFESSGQQSSRDIFRSSPTSSKTKRSKQSQQAPRKLLWMVSVTCVVFLGILVIRLSGSSSGSGGKGQSFQEAMARGLSAEKVGDYPRALEAFNEAQNLKSRDPEVLLHLAPLVLTLENRSLEAERIWNQILELEPSANYKKSATMGLGLVALANQQYDQAFNRFADVLKTDPQFSTALGNLGIVQFYRGHLVEAEELLVRTLGQGADGVFALAIADVAHAIADEKNDKAKLKTASDMLKIYIESMHDYRQEALLVSARTLLLLGKESEAQSSMEEFYDTDPEQTEAHLRDWMVFRNRVTWDSLVDVYRKVSVQLGQSPRASAGLGVVLFKTQEKNKGADLIKQALQQAPNDPIVLALDGWVQMQLGNRERATTSINEAVKRTTKQKLPYLMAARLCEESRDWECAKKQWENLHRVSSDSVQSLVGLARANFETKRADQASVYVKQALATDPTYTPALALAQKIQSNREVAQ